MSAVQKAASQVVSPSSTAWRFALPLDVLDPETCGESRMRNCSPDEMDASLHFGCGGSLARAMASKSLSTCHLEDRVNECPVNELQSDKQQCGQRSHFVILLDTLYCCT